MGVGVGKYEDTQPGAERGDAWVFRVGEEPSLIYKAYAKKGVGHATHGTQQAAEGRTWAVGLRGRDRGGGSGFVVGAGGFISAQQVIAGTQRIALPHPGRPGWRASCVAGLWVSHFSRVCRTRHCRITMLPPSPQVGATIREKLIPEAVSWYTGEAMDEDGLYLPGDDDEDDEE